jgi:plasmid stability protein
MRTTLTLDDDLAKQLREKARRSGESFKDVVNEALRRGLRGGEKPSPPLPRFVVQAKARGFRPGVDILHLNRFFGELETEEFLRKEAERRAKDDRS